MEKGEEARGGDDGAGLSQAAAGRRGEMVPCRTRIYWLTVAALFAAGAYQRFSLPATPFSDPDTWGYLFPGLSGLARGVFVHTYGRTFVYPLFVYGVLRGFGDFIYVSVFQHLLGLASGVLLLAAWRGLARWLPQGGPVRPLHRWLGLVTLAVFLLSKTSLLMEHSIRPEAVFPFFAIACIWLALGYWRAFERGNLGGTFCWGAALVFDSLLLYFLKPAWGFGALFAMMPVLVSLFLLRGHLSFKIFVMLVPALLVYGMLYVPERRLIREYDPRADCFLPSLLLSVHADIILDEMTRDLASGEVPAPERELIPKLVALIRAEIVRNAHESSKLAINPDVFLYGKTNVCSLVQAFFGKDNAAYEDFCFSYYRKAWLHQPVRMLSKVLRQLRAFYSWENQGYDASMRAVISYSETALRTRKALNELTPPLPLFSAYREASIGLEHSTGRWRQLIPLSVLNMLLYGSFPVVFFTSVAACCAVLAWRKELAPLALWTLYFHSYNFGNCLTIAVVHNMQVGRYVKNQLIYTVFSECCGVLLLVAAFEACRCREARASSMLQSGGSVAGK